MTVQAANAVTGSIVITTTTETVANFLPVVAQGTAKGVNLIFGYVNLTTGVAGTTVVIRVRTGPTAAGTLVGNADTFTTAAAGLYQVPFCVIDTVNFPYGSQYCVTVTQPAATGNGSIQDSCIVLDVISPAA